MKISLQWLCDYVEVGDYRSKPDELGRHLVAAGLEVESIEDLGQRFQHVVVGHILELKTHPDADRLTVCQVDIGGGEKRQIVCGARNHKQGDKVVASLPGAVLPGDFAIKKSKIRGVESEGMLCSETELGISDTSEGIMILPPDALVGESFARYMGFEDVIFELSVTPNRADCLSHLGLARELGAILGRPVATPQPKFQVGADSTRSAIALEHRETELCPRYAGRLIRGVKVGQSPRWLKARLESVGLSSINNVVDITNYVMMELGQPLHAFDVRHLKGAKVAIERARAGETFVSLDGSEFRLEGFELTIRDGERAVALAGVVGGRNSGVVDDTRDLFIESAHFAPESVRRTARRWGVETDSAYRFSRGTDPEGVGLALERCCQLIQEICGGQVAGDAYDSYPKPHAPRDIPCELPLIETRLGFPVPAAEFEEWMKRLGCEVRTAGPGRYRVRPPAWRWDLAIPEDLIEEFARLHGYEHIPETLPVMTENPGEHVADFLNERRVSAALRAQGFHQAVNYNFISEEFARATLGLPEGGYDLGVRLSDRFVRLKNPLSEDLNVMRNSLMPSLLKCALHNYRYGRLYGRLFEIGATFAHGESGYEQFQRVGLIGWGQQSALWSKDEARPAVFDVKGAVEALLARLQSTSWSWRSLDGKSPAPAFLHPGQAALLFYEGRVIGFVGTLHPRLREEHKIRHDAAVAELDMTALMRGQPRLPKTKALSRFPAVERDFAFVVPDTLAVSEIIKHIQKVGGSGLQKVEIFDVFRGPAVGEGKRSVAFRLTYQSMDDTLSEEKLTELQRQVIGEVGKKFGIEVR